MRKPQKADPKRVVGYLRVSKEEQSLGPEAQREQLERWCAANGAQLVATFEDRVTSVALLDKRPALMEALDALRAHGAGVLLVAKRDRIARDVMLAAMLESLAEKAGARILCADGTGNADGPEGMLIRGIADLFAQYERAMIRTRTKAALAVKKARGELVGTAPYGFERAADGVRLVPNAREQLVVALIAKLRHEGRTLQEITNILNAGPSPARGTRWHLTTVHRIIKAA